MANIPIIYGVPFPMKIVKLPVKKVGFLMDLDRLAQLRAERVGRMARVEVPGYSQMTHILKEVDYCEKLFRKIPHLWTIDVTNRSIEETSEWITRNVL